MSKIDSSLISFDVKNDLVQILDLILRDHEQARQSLLNEVIRGNIEINPKNLEDSIPEYFASKESYLESLHRLLEKVQDRDSNAICLNIKEYLVKMISYLEEYT